MLRSTIVKPNQYVAAASVAKFAVPTLAARSFHYSRINFNDRPSGESPMKVFFNTFKQEVQKSSELKENIKALQDESGRMAESEAFKRAKEAYAKAQLGTSAAGKVVLKAADVAGDVAVKAWDSPVGKGVRTTVRVTADVADKAFEPVRKTQVYKDVSEVIDDGSSTAYGGFLTKEQREALRQKELQDRIKKGWKGPVRENEEAGGELVATEHKASGPGLNEKWEKFKLKSPVGRGISYLQEKWEESENGLIALVRTIFEKVTGFFAETEQAKVIKKLRMMDPNFRLTDFQKTLTNYIVPEILDAYIKNEDAVLKQWLSEAPYNVWQANNKQFIQQGLFSDSKILDIRGIEIVTCKTIQPNETPVIVVSCRAQEIHLYRKAKTGEIAAGTEDSVQLSTYAMVLTRVPEEFENKTTEGWKIVEFARGASRPFH
ncbi:putative mitochondrial inner membrane translocase subunit [Spathaspora passalidarum NRRL Y-27907]|uniref:Mitochondrial import inner membrane translocase subunit TIM44 n=1 Tax=Spathaspora passalidarum (strain NRRL Y-27907 / 11-Y1) TaxID=619300 RepID=G3AQW8_SPAPN|nr:putative mitochondrial inner membrane translocase subunit [Spathaspora passalidarum NRRL Y-27907]EGW31197.1 putative mitochondrial inner membrane translocase subunit [Spathaspora passalidarum NRRL Y-27907]